MEILKEWMAVAIAVISLIGWLVRMEGRVNDNSKEILRLERQIELDRIAAREARAETNEILKEVRGDIKTLIREGRIQHFTERTAPPGRD